MEGKMITEFVEFKVLETTTDEQLISKADNLINNFWEKEGGFINAELVKGIEGNNWCFIYHNESLEKLKTSGGKMRNTKEFGKFISLVVPESIRVTFFHKLKMWK